MYVAIKFNICRLSNFTFLIASYFSASDKQKIDLLLVSFKLLHNLDFLFKFTLFDIILFFKKTANMSSPFNHFEDFDQVEIYKRYEAALFEPSTQNVIVDFDNATALASLNVDCDSVKKILQTKV